MASARVYRAAIELRDDHNPVFTSPPVGSLTSGAVLAGTHGVAFTASDVGSGLQRAVIEVDGRVAAVQTFGCGPPYTATLPCPLMQSGTVALDTSSLFDGAHSVRVLVQDATQSNAIVFGPFSIRTANAPTTCAPGAAPGVTVATRSRTIAYGARASVRGRVAGAGAGATVRVFSRIARAGEPTTLTATTLTTDAAGSFSYRVPRGPSRELRFATRGAGDTAYRCSSSFALRVRPRVALSARATASGVRLTGRLLGGHVPSRGKLVELQRFEDGRWQSLRTVRTNSQGEFRSVYRASSGRLRIRAVVRPDDSYPWAFGTSRRVSVRVR
jgi:hypothetical protein